MKTIKDMPVADVKKAELLMLEHNIKQIHIVIKQVNNKVHIDGVIISSDGDEINIGIKVDAMRLASYMGKAGCPSYAMDEAITYITEGADIKLIV